MWQIYLFQNSYLILTFPSFLWIKKNTLIWQTPPPLYKKDTRKAYPSLIEKRTESFEEKKTVGKKISFKIHSPILPHGYKWMNVCLYVRMYSTFSSKNSCIQSIYLEKKYTKWICRVCIAYCQCVSRRMIKINHRIWKY